MSYLHQNPTLNLSTLPVFSGTFTNHHFVSFNPQSEVAPRPVKRRRTTATPVEHRELAALKKLERDSAKMLNLQSCPTHARMMDLPVYTLKQLQSQGVALGRTNESLEVLSSQVAELTHTVKTAVTLLPPKSSQGPRLNTPNIDPDLLKSYYTIITKTLDQIKQFQEKQLTRPQSPSTSYHRELVRTATDCVHSIRNLIMIQCQFDCLGGVQAFPAIKIPVNVNLVTAAGNLEGMTTTWDQVYNAVLTMERNLRMYLEHAGVFKRFQPIVTFQPICAPSQQHHYRRELSSIPEPKYTSTPIKTTHRKLNQPERSFGKRKIDEGPENPVPYSSDLEIESRGKLIPKQFSFTYRGEPMESD